MPHAEVCDDLDNDCNGLTDEVFPLGESCLGSGLCSDDVGSWLCDAQGGVVCSVDLPSHADYRGTEEICNGEDDDCDGREDETCRASVWRFEESGTMGGCESNYRLSLNASAPSGWEPAGSAPLFEIYTLPMNGLAPLVELRSPSYGEFVYAYDVTEIGGFESDGWIQTGVLGYVSPTQSESAVLTLYRLISGCGPSRAYSVNPAEIVFWSSTGAFNIENPIGWVW